MAQRTGYYDRLHNKWIVSATDGAQISRDEEKPFITFKETIDLNLYVKEVGEDGTVANYTGWSGAAYSFEFAIDNDWQHFLAGTTTLNTALAAGAITEIKIDGLTETPLTSGNIVLQNAAGESESVAYSAWSLASSTYTFTVSATLAYSYIIGDTAKVVESALIEVDNADIDSTNKDTGNLIVTLDADTISYLTAVEGSANINNCRFELSVYDASADLVDTVAGEFICNNRLRDDLSLPPPAPGTSYYTKTQSDARYMLQSGATADYDMNGFGFTEVGRIELDLTDTTTLAEGMMRWDDDDKTLVVGMEATGVSLQVGQEIHLRATNKTGVQISNGEVVYVDGAQGQRPTIALAKGDAEATSSGTIGIVTHDINNNDTGYVTVFGLVRDVDTSGFTEGDVLYLSAATAGVITNVEPTSPNHAVRIGYCLYGHASEGIILVRVQNGWELNELHDVHYANTLAGGQTLQYNASASRWENYNSPVFGRSSVGVVDVMSLRGTPSVTEYTAQWYIGEDKLIFSNVSEYEISGDLRIGTSSALNSVSFTDYTTSYDISNAGSSSTYLSLNRGANDPVYLFVGAGNGEVQDFRIYGNYATTLRYLQIAHSADDEVTLSGVSTVVVDADLGLNLKYIYLKGDALTNDSIRMYYDNTADEVIFQARDSGTWTDKQNLSMA